MIPNTGSKTIVESPKRRTQEIITPHQMQQVVLSMLEQKNLDCQYKALYIYKYKALTTLYILI